MIKFSVDGTVPYRGVQFEYGDQLLIVPPLSSRLLEEHGARIDQLTTKGTYTLKQSGKFLKENLAPPVRDALKRNYGDAVTDEDALDFITAENWADIVGALLGNSGMSKTRKGEQLPVGPLKGDSSISIGSPSAPESLAPPAGAGSTSSTN